MLEIKEWKKYYQAKTYPKAYVPTFISNKIDFKAKRSLFRYKKRHYKFLEK